MGTTRQYRYRIECITNDAKVRPGTYVFGMDKKPDIKDWCEAQEKSELPGGVNEHLAHARGFLLAIHSAILIKQSNGEIVEAYQAGPFRPICG